MKTAARSNIFRNMLTGSLVVELDTQVTRDFVFVPDGDGSTA